MYNLDIIIINNLKVPAHIGCSTEEQEASQFLGINLELGIAKWKDGNGDLSDTVCYATVANEVVELTERRSWFLVEELASGIIANIFDNHKTVMWIRIEVRKFALPNADWAGVRMERSRELVK